MTESNEKQLWCEVLFRALEDGTNGCLGPRGRNTSIETYTRNALRQIEADRNYFRTTNPDFLMVCGMAGQDPAFVAKRAHALFAEKPAQDIVDDALRRYKTQPRKRRKAS